MASTTVYKKSTAFILPVFSVLITNGILFRVKQSIPHSQSQTVVVENPMSFDGSGKLVISYASSHELIYICRYS